ncbi:DUF4126 domain-containing protein [Rubrobacter taiwanensis]|uniref:DUF4126 domain-containing protein n=1 Tax=Rubrobacter taiwanensis TaxID=185139 RepID=A0A4R1BDS7_9ACTN|nr:DUF4126 domain-containing protein [Rubrobacter taiwanensis]
MFWGRISGVEALFAAGIATGLAAVAGIRAYLPLLLIGLFARLGFFELPAPFDLLEGWAVMAALAVLAVLESVLDKVPALETAVNVAQTPLRMAAGAVLFAAALGAGLGVEYASELAAGGLLAGAVSGLKAFLRPANDATAAGVSGTFLSAFEDVVALVGAVIAVFVPLVSLVLVGFLLFFFYRIKRRRRRKFQGLRILGD